MALNTSSTVSITIIIIIKTFIHTTGERVFKTQLERLSPQTTQNKTQIKQLEQQREITCTRDYQFA
jgi:hypothetical protein